MSVQPELAALDDPPEESGDAGPPLLYLYGVVPASSPTPPDDVRGVEGRPVRVVPIDGLGALVSEVAAAGYLEAALDRHLEDLEWVGERAVAHDRVLTWCAGRGPVIPLSPFSLHADEARLRTRIRSQASDFERLLDSLRGRNEWGVKVWRDDAVLDQHLEALSPKIAALAREIATAGQGRRFLLRKKQGAMRAEEARQLSDRLMREFFGQLEKRSERGTVLPLPAPAAGDDVHPRRLVLHSAFLVPEGDFRSFHEQVSRSVEELRESGFTFELAGPLPPYRFSELE